MTWQDVKSRIEAQIDENWLKEPEAMWKTRHGINVTGAGSFNQYLSTMMFVDVYTIAYGQHMFFMFVQMSDDPEISLDVLKKMTHNELAVGFQSMQFLSYVSTPEINEFAKMIDEVLLKALVQRRRRETLVMLSFTESIMILQFTIEKISALEIKFLDQPSSVNMIRQH